MPDLYEAEIEKLARSGAAEATVRCEYFCSTVAMPKSGHLKWCAQSIVGRLSDDPDHMKHRAYFLI